MIGKSTNKNAGPIGIDLASTGVRLVQCQSLHQQPALIDAAHESLPHAGPVTDAAYYEQALAVAKRLIDKGGFSGRRCVIVLPDAVVQTKNIRMPEMPASDMASAVAWEASERFGFSPDARKLTRHLVAGTVQQGADQRMEVLIMAASAPLIDSITQAIVDHGLDPEAIEVAPTAMAYSAAVSLPDTAQRVMIDIGHTATKVAVCTNDGPRFFKTIESGLERLDRRVAEVMPSAGPAPQLRQKLADQSADLQAQYAEAIGPWIQELAQEVALCLRYDAVTYRGTRATEAFFLGGGNRLPGLAEAMSQTAAVECRAYQPFCNIQGSEGHSTHHVSWAVAIGVALRPRFTSVVGQRGAA